MSCEVDGDASRELGLRSLDAVSCAVSQQGDGLAILSSSEGGLEGCVGVIADLCDDTDVLQYNILSRIGLVDSGILSTTNDFAYSLDGFLLISIGVILSDGHILYGTVSDGAGSIAANAAEVAIARDIDALNRAASNG